MHGLIQFNKNEYSTMIKAGIARAVANGVKIGRPTNLTPEIESDVVKDRKLGHSIRSLARKYSIGTGTVYKILGKHNV
jgi:DNA invertase Pin-like site-specific DNA recombinase